MMDDPNIEPGQVWEKKSFPLPTVVTIVAVEAGEGDKLKVKHGRKTHVVERRVFLGQGFRRADLTPASESA